MPLEQETSIFGDLHPYRVRFEIHDRLPSQGVIQEEILGELQAMANEEDKKWETGLVSGTMYHGGKEHYAFLNQVYNLFSYVNLLQRDLCPSGTKFESEITNMVVKMLHGDQVPGHHPGEEACGLITSGGTESIYNGMFVHREWGWAEKGIQQAEVIIASTAHPAFSKAAHYLGMKVIETPVTSGFEADPGAMRQQITPNTVALVGTAGTYPHGVVDPIAELSDLAVEHQIGLHVDGCLGGFILPWIEKLGYPVPVFDFRLPGVTTISCDTHKYGYGLKGTSTLLFRSKKLRRHAYFSKPDWSGGMYASPTVQGSRSAGLSAATWAAMVSMGEQGYLEAARAIMRASDTIRAGIAQIPELKILGKSTFLLSLGSDVVNIYHVNDYLAMKGWRMNGCQNPPGFHFCLTLRQTLPGVAEQFVQDLGEAVSFAKDPPYDYPKTGALYGLAGTLEGKQMLSEGMKDFIDLTYEVR
jgi:glutamate/tyrosine decarboxylase-like PLP-dependent enzyme